MIDIALIQSSLPALLRGSIYTIEIAAFSCTIGVILGMVAGLALSSSNRALRAITMFYTALFRGTPMLIQILIAAFAIPTIGIPISKFWAVVLAIGLNSGAYIAHIIKSGIGSVSVGQREAGRTLGLSHAQIVWYIVLPQAIRVVLPALGNEFITLIKDSSLASYVGVQELTKEGDIIASRTFDFITMYAIVALFYLVITGILSIAVSALERRMNRHA